MKCPYCESTNIEVYSGFHKGPDYIRYRKCRNCFKNFKTVEQLTAIRTKKKKMEVTA